jgi:hypothetical protein
VSLAPGELLFAHMITDGRVRPAATERSHRVAVQTEELVRAELVERGYVEVDEFEGLRAGGRVRHSGEQFPSAAQHGTGTVVAVYERTNSAWSRLSYNGFDVEVIVDRDKPSIGGQSTISQWASYATVRARWMEVMS